MLKFNGMKASLLCLLLFTSCGCFAQNVFFAEPGIGLGLANVRASNPPDIYPLAYGTTGWGNHTKSVFSYNPSLLIGYKHSKWSLSLGVSYLRTGYIDDQMYFVSFGSNEPYNKMTEYYYHVIVPVIFSEQFKLGKHFFISPGFGFALSYNTSATEKYRGMYAFTSSPVPLTNDEFNQTYFRVVGWEILRVQMGYKLNDRLNIIAGPEYQFMLSSFIKDNDNYEINRAYTIKMGITWMLKKIKKPETQVGTPGVNTTQAMPNLN